MIAIGNYCMSAEINHVPKKNSEGTRKKRWMMSKDGENLVEAVRPLLERIDKLEAELEMYERDETFGTLAIQLTKLEAENKTQQTALTFIVDIGYDYDGFGKVDSLKKLIDEMVGYARNPQSAVDALTGGDDDGAIDWDKVKKEQV